MPGFFSAIHHLCHKAARGDCCLVLVLLCGVSDSLTDHHIHKLKQSVFFERKIWRLYFC